MPRLFLFLVTIPALATGNYCVDRADGNWSSPSTWACYQQVKVASFVPGTGGGTPGTYTAGTPGGGTCSIHPTVKYTVNASGVIGSVWLVPDFQKGSYGRCTVADTTVPLAAGGGNVTGASITLALAGAAVSVPGDGDTAAVQTHHVIIDGNIGTSAAGGSGRIEMYRTSGAAPTLDVNCSSPRTIIFRSTGNSPFGSGSAVAPASDATMFGLVDAGGALNLTCTSNPPTYPFVFNVTYGNPTIFTLSGNAPATDTGVTVFSPSCPALDGIVGLATNTGTDSFAVPVDSSACTTPFGSSTEDSLTINPLTITTADQVSPIYVVATTNWLNTGQGATIATDYLAVNRLGTGATTVSAPSFGGFGVSGSSSSVTANLTLSRTYVAGGFGLVSGYTWGAVGISKVAAGGQFTIGPAQGGLISIGIGNSGSVSAAVSDFVALAQANVAADNRYAIYGGYFGSAFGASRIAVQGTNTVRQSGLSGPGVGASTAGSPNIQDLLCASPGDSGFSGGYATCAKLTVPGSPATVSLAGLVSDGPSYATFNYGNGNSNGTGTMSDLWAAAKSTPTASGSQGIFITRGGEWRVSNLVGIVDACPKVGSCGAWFGWPGNGTPIGATLDQALLDANNQDAIVWVPYELQTYGPAALRSSLLIGSYAAHAGWYTSSTRYCGSDPGGGAVVTYAADSLATGAVVGVHHNATYNCPPAQEWSPARGGIDYWDGSHPHPNAVYDDTTADRQDPRRIAPSRRVADADRMLFGGPGTQDHLFREMAKISGFGGPYTLSSDHQLPIARIRQWLIEGHQPTNLAYKGAGWQGVDIGPVAITTFASPGANTSSSYATRFSGGTAF